MNEDCTYLKSRGRQDNVALMPWLALVQVISKRLYIYIKIDYGFNFQIIYVQHLTIYFLAEAPIHSVGYQSLVGNNEHSWGWDLGRNKVYHNSKQNPGVTYPANLKHDETFVVPDKFLGKQTVCLLQKRIDVFLNIRPLNNSELFFSYA